MIIIHCYRMKKLRGIRREIVTTKLHVSYFTYFTSLFLLRLSAISHSKERRAKCILDDIRCHYFNDGINDTRGIRYSFELLIIRRSDSRLFLEARAFSKVRKRKLAARKKNSNHHGISMRPRIMKE